VQKIPSSYKDPSSAVFCDEETQRYFRALRFDPIVYNNLGVFPKVLEGKEGDLFEVAKIPFVNYFYEWTFEQFKDSALFFLELLKSLDDKGYTFSDATPLNITYNGKGEFVFIDHGSLVLKDGDKWNAFYQFIKEYAYPLLYLYENPLLPPLGLLPFIGSKDWMFTYKPRLSNRLSFKYALLKSALTLSSKKSLTDFSEKKKSGFANQYRYNIEFFLDYIKGLNQKLPKATRWGNYYSETVLGDDYVQNKKKSLLEFFQIIAPEVKIGVDLGASDGMMSEQIVTHFPGIKFISVESDPVASKSLYQRSKSSVIVPIYNSLYGMTPALGFSGAIDSIKERLSKSADVVMGLGLIHHLMHEENLAFDEILMFLSSLIRPDGFIVVEYVKEEDPRHKLIANPNYPYLKGLEQWESSLSNIGQIIKKVPLAVSRVLYLVKKR
jgi:hypothetical protein